MLMAYGNPVQFEGAIPHFSLPYLEAEMALKFYVLIAA